MQQKEWLAYSLEELEALFKSWGEKKYRAKQFFSWLHDKQVANWAEITNLPSELIEKLQNSGGLRSLQMLEQQLSADKLTAKWLFATTILGEPNYIETVLIKEQHGRRRTVCVSCMAGCPLSCVFCATGKGGYVRNLSAAEILEQLYVVEYYCRKHGETVNNVVFMGMGEPFLNFDAVLRAADLMSSQAGMNLSGRHITISTVGVLEGIKSLLAADRNYRLAISLHAPNQKLREKLIPTAKSWRLDDLMPLVKEFSYKNSRGVMFEYCLIEGVNSSLKDADELIGLLENINCKVNLLPLNEIAGFDGKAPHPEKVKIFRDKLINSGIPATIRVDKGRDIAAACGQLKAQRIALENP